MRTHIRLSFAFAAALALVACGGGGSSGNTGTGGSSGGGSTTANVEGIWQGSYTVNGVAGSTKVYAAIAKGGYAFFYDAQGNMFVLPQLTGSTTLSGTLTGYAPQGSTFSNGATIATFALTGTVSNTAITGSYSGSAGSGTFTLSPYVPFTGNPSIVSGNWQGFYVGSGSPAAVALTVQPAGVFAGTDANGCTISGNMTQRTGENLFVVGLDAGGNSNCVGQLNGLAYESNVDASGLFGGTTGVYYYVGVSNAGNAFVAELKAQ